MRIRLTRMLSALALVTLVLTPRGRGTAEDASLQLYLGGDESDGLAANQPTNTVFYDRTFVFSYLGSSVCLSSQADECTPTAIDDAVRIYVNGVEVFYQESRTHDFGPVDFSSKLHSGSNEIRVQIIDLMGPSRGGSALWLVPLQTNADRPSGACSGFHKGEINTQMVDETWFIWGWFADILKPDLSTALRAVSESGNAWIHESPSFLSRKVGEVPIHILITVEGYACGEGCTWEHVMVSDNQGISGWIAVNDISDHNPGQPEVTCRENPPVAQPTALSPERASPSSAWPDTLVGVWQGTYDCAVTFGPTQKCQIELEIKRAPDGSLDLNVAGAETKFEQGKYYDHDDSTYGVKQGFYCFDTYQIHDGQNLHIGYECFKPISNDQLAFEESTLGGQGEGNLTRVGQSNIRPMPQAENSVVTIPDHSGDTLPERSGEQPSSLFCSVVPLLCPGVVSGKDMYPRDAFNDGNANFTQCTEYVQTKRPDVLCWIRPPANAGVWADRIDQDQAALYGIKVDNSPEIGDIVVWPKDCGMGSAGHVAYVQAAKLSSNKIQVFDANRYANGLPDGQVHEDYHEYAIQPCMKFIHEPTVKIDYKTCKVILEQPAQSSPPSIWDWIRSLFGK